MQDRRGTPRARDAYGVPVRVPGASMPRDVRIVHALGYLAVP
jgi:hypothetical protein